MSEKCEKCKGTGFLTVTVEKCPQCGGSKGKGSGKVSVDLMALSEQNLSSILSGECPKCGGTGEIEHKIKCDVCRGSGEIYHCRKCGKQIPYLNENNEEICNMCRASSTVYRLDASCDYDDLGIGKYYVGVVDGIVENLGAFVRLNDNVKGLMHEKNITKMPEKGEEQIVYLKDMRKQGRDVKLDLVQKNPKEYEISVVEKNVPGTHIGDITPAMNGKLVRIRGEVIQVKQTGGPTIFTISDETGRAPCAGFSTAGQRSYSHIDAGMIVSAVGTVNLRDGAVQIELAGMKELPEEEKIRLLEIIEKA
ncbi:MAG: phosphoesterase, partial [Methanosarcinaceae archaeon]|nr:phosphoesterase [Methanosarcinaceae archaeon]